MARKAPSSKGYLKIKWEQNLVYIINSFKYDLELRIFPQVVIINNIIWEFSFDGCESDDIFFFFMKMKWQTKHI